MNSNLKYRVRADIAKKDLTGSVFGLASTYFQPDA